jgi:hypothetical protein
MGGAVYHNRNKLNCITAVNRDRFGESVAADRLLQKPQCGLWVAVLGQQKVNRLAVFVHGAGEKLPTIVCDVTHGETAYDTHHGR